MINEHMIFYDEEEQLLKNNEDNLYKQMQQRKLEESEIESEAVSEEIEIDQKDKVNDQQLNNFINNEGRFKIDLYMEFLERNQIEYNEIVKNFNVELFLTKNHDLNLNELINYLKKIGYPMNRKLISYYYFDAEIYVQCGQDPLDQPVYISWAEIASRGLLRLRIKNRDDQLIHILMTEEVNDQINQFKDKFSQQKQKNDNKVVGKRTKERRIGFIIDKVCEWRNLYNGKDGPQNRQTLDESALKVGISKKSLDDYLLQIRYGKKFGFNFNEHKNDKVGVLRAFVKHNLKKHKSKEDT